MQKSLKYSGWLAPTLCLLVAVFACNEVPEELSRPMDNVPIPSGLSILIGADAFTLSWEFDIDFEYSGFVIFRSEDDRATWTRVATVQTPPYVDANLRRGLVYWYRVAGVNVDGVEGSRSTPVPVRAAVYAVTIDGGAPYTNARDVTLTFTAPPEVAYLRVSENPGLAGAEWRDFDPPTPFVLSAGDGLKTVYAEFQDASGNLTQTFSGSIKLDTFAEISALDFFPTTAIPRGGTVHFRVRTTGGELDGFAQVFVEGMGSDPIAAFDDGMRGDPQARDGSYEVDYTFPQFFRGRDLRMSAIFFDAAGNESAEREFANDLSITDPPAAVSLYPAVDSTIASITLRWTESEEVHFASYAVYRDKVASVDAEKSTLAGRVTQQGTTTLTDSGLLEAVGYYYAVFVVNDLGEKTRSTVRYFRTADKPPFAVTLDPPSAVGTNRLTLTWSENTNTDFDRYEIWQHTSPGVTNAAPSTRNKVIFDQGEVFADITGIDTTANTYYFKVYVHDKQGGFSRSNEVSTLPGS